jgi:hypothetical protein
MEDSIHQHTNYVRAALLASKVYLYLHEHPYSSSNADDDVRPGLVDKPIPS